MKKLALLLAALHISPALIACEVSLIGKWQSDAVTTMSFNRANARLEVRQDRFLDSLMGKMTLEFTDKQLHMYMPDTQVTVNDKLMPLVGFDKRAPYKVLFCNERMVAVESTEPFTGDTEVTTYFFVGSDAMWAYAGNNNAKTPDLHIREYFKRVK